jgi:hypothetical protein
VRPFDNLFTNGQELRFEKSVAANIATPAATQHHRARKNTERLSAAVEEKASQF